ncbi:MAG: GLUG motif-containing protein, partial [Candidatus Natronoplasma sp.]
MVVGLLVMSGMSVGVVLGEGSLERSVEEGSIAEGTPEKEEGLPEFAGGDGSPANPYQINNWTQLDDVRYNLNDNFILLNDLNNTVEGYDEVVGDPSDPNNEGFDPIGNDSDPFEGSFDGDRYAIEDMWIAKPEKNHCGLFGGASSAEVVDLSMLNASVEGNESVGALIGGSEATQVSNISVNGSVTGNSYIGGIVGVGGSNTVIELSRANVIVDGDSGVGGIIGYTFENLGNGAYIANTYSVGKISGESKVGGIAGHISLNSALNKSYSLCEVNGVNETGGVVGYNYYVADSMSRASPAVGYNENNTEGRVTSAPKDDLQNIRLYTDDDFENYDPLYKEWNITEVGYGEIDDGSIWNIVNNETYPFFSWEGYAGYNLEIQAGEGGTTDPEPGTHGYGEGTEVTVKALPDEGWSFANWTGDVPESEKENEEITIVMDEDKSIKANFHPLEIYDWKDLYEIRYSLDENYTLMNDLNETTPYYGEYVGDEEKGWKPIGEDGNEFIGTFDGQGYEIRDLYIDRPDEDSGEYYLGLFGVADDGAKIIDLGVVDANVSGEYYVGGLVGNNAGTVSNSYATGNMSGDYYVGGLVGSNDGTIENSYATGNMSGGSLVGGLVGRSNDGTIENSYATGDVNG